MCSRGQVEVRQILQRGHPHRPLDSRNYGPVRHLHYHHCPHRGREVVAFRLIHYLRQLLLCLYYSAALVDGWSLRY